MKNKNKETLLDDQDLPSGDETALPGSDSEQEAGTQAAEIVIEDSVEAKRDEYLELWKRAQADYKNLRRRGQADLDAGIRRSMQPLLDNLLLVLDHLDMALSAPTPTEETRNFAIGVQMTRDQLMNALTQEQVKEIPTDGQFDPEMHQAVETVTDSESEPGTIVEALRKGYSWRGVVLRFAQVRVAAAAESTETDSASAPDTETE